MAVINSSGYIEGTIWDDTITGSLGVDTLVGGAGMDLLDGGSFDAKDVLIGGDDGDTYIYHHGATIIEQAGDSGIDYVTWNSPGFLTYTLPANVEGFSFSGEGSGAITGNELENNLYGGKYTDNLYGGAGEDKLDGRGGDDRMVGGEGDDRYEVDSYNDVVVEEYGQGTDTIRTPLDFFDLGTYANIEWLWYIGDRNFYGIGNGLDNQLISNGGHGNDTLDGGGGADTLAGGDGDDTYIIDKFDVIDETWNDGIDTVLISGFSLYTLVNDVENVTQKNSEDRYFVVHGNNLGNVLRASSKNGHELYGHDGNDLLVGGGSYNLLDGGAGNDTIQGAVEGSGDVAKLSGKKSDYDYVITSEKIVLYDKRGIDGTDTFLNVESFAFSNAQITISEFLGGPKPPVVTPPQPPIEPLPPTTVFIGFKGNDTLIGNAEANTLKGLRGNDKIFGAEKSDKLYGGLGNDTLYGGTGADKFVFDTKPNARTNKDVIKDFRVVDDTIWLDNAVFNKVGKNGSLKAGAFHVNKTGAAHDASDRIIYDKDSGVLYYDKDGTGAAAGIAFAAISKKLALTHKDFLVL